MQFIICWWYLNKPVKTGTLSLVKSWLRHLLVCDLPLWMVVSSPVKWEQWGLLCLSHSAVMNISRRKRPSGCTHANKLADRQYQRWSPRKWEGPILLPCTRPVLNLCLIERNGDVWCLILSEPPLAPQFDYYLFTELLRGNYRILKWYILEWEGVRKLWHHILAPEGCDWMSLVPDSGPLTKPLKRMLNAGGSGE